MAYRASRQRKLQQNAGNPLNNNQKIVVQKLWQELFSDPSKWWDNRSQKANERYPDFKQKTTHEPLWLNGTLKPSWVDAKLAALPLGTLQQSNFSWNKRLIGNVKAGRYVETLEIFEQMQRDGISPDRFTFVPALNACARLKSLEDGRRIHKMVIEKGCENDEYVGNSLIDMYSKCRSLVDAYDVFQRMPERTVVAWGALVLGHVKCGQALKAMELFRRMEVEEVEPDPRAYVGMLNACASVGALEEGRRVHEQIIHSGCSTGVFLSSSLVDMYAKCGSIEEARRVFDKMPARNVVSWNAMILGHTKCGQGLKALELFGLMQEDGMEPDHVTFAGALGACAAVKALEEGKRIHEMICQERGESNVFLACCLVDMYAKCGAIEDAKRVFDRMPTHNVVAWSILILGYVKCGQGQKALHLSKLMQEEGVEPNAVTFVAVLNACASEVALEEGRNIHKHVIQSGCERDVGNSLLDMYSKCGSMDEAWALFVKMRTDNVIAWNTMILGYAKNGQGKKALELFEHMQSVKVEPNAVTYLGVLNACASFAGIREGRSIHSQIIESFKSDLYVGNSLIDMYSKCGSIRDAWKVFTEMPTRNVVSWNAMILGFVNCQEGQKALELGKQMKEHKVMPDSVTFMGLLNACSSVGALQTGRAIHANIVENGCESEVFLGSSLVDMYAKCGVIEDAKRVFDKIPTRDIACWNAMLQGYSMNGLTEEALALFEQMIRFVKADRVTFVCLLQSCSHAGFVDEGLQYFDSMSSVYCVCPTLDHYACIVDLLGRAGRVHEGKDVIESMLCEPDLSIWISLLGACRVHGNLELGQRTAKRVLEFDPGKSGQWDASKL